jgi:hypothetical protein
MDELDEKRLHDSMRIVGLRATVTAVGLLTLTRELVDAGVLSEAALDRIKTSMVKELAINKPPAQSKEQYERDVRKRLDDLFAGARKLEAVPPAAE